MKTLLIMIFFLVSAAHAQVICKHNGANWQPFHESSQIFIGKTRHGYRLENECQASVAKTKHRGACVWNGEFYTAYNHSGQVLGGLNYRDADICAEAMTNEKNGLLCLWNGSNWQPWSIEFNRYIGIAGKGFSDRPSCLVATNSASREIACNWNGEHFSPYEIKSNTLLGVVANYSVLRTCTDTIKSVRNGLMCLWNRANWQPYSLTTKTYLGKTGFGFNEFNDCKESISNKMGGACNWDGNGYSAFVEGQEAAVSPMVFLNTGYCIDFLDKVKNKSITAPQLTNAQLATPFRRSSTAVGYTLTQCHDSRHNYHNVKTNANGELIEGCFPDTLYSWGDYGKTKWFKDRYSAPGNWSAPLSREFFLTTSPLATFGYGPIALRIKLRRGLKYRLTYPENRRLYCSDLTDQEKSDTLIINQWSVDGGTGVDYVICSMGVVSSWSFGTREHYDEILRELEWVKTHDYKEYELYYKKNGVDQLWGVSVDNNDFSETNFYRHLANQRQLIDLELGGIFSQSTDTEEDHFRTYHPIYFNPE